MSVSYSDTRSPLTTFEITDENSLVQQESTMARLAAVDVAVRGAGCFLLQVGIIITLFYDSFLFYSVLFIVFMLSIVLC